MPFKSQVQSKACFATGGFGGKVDCGEFAGHTNYASLPEKVAARKTRQTKFIGRMSDKNKKL